MKIFLREFLWILLILAVVVLHVSVVNTFFVQYPIVHLILLVAFFFCAVDMIPRGLLSLAIGGYLLDLFSSFPFGVTLVSLFVGLGTFLFLQHTVFKNKALHAMVINASLATIAFQATFLLFIWILQQLTIVSAAFQFVPAFQSAGIQVAVHAILITLFTALFTLWKRRVFAV